MLCHNMVGFLKNVLKRQKKAHLKKERRRTCILMWLGREIVQKVARTRKRGGSQSTPRSILSKNIVRIWVVYPKRIVTTIFHGSF